MGGRVFVQARYNKLIISVLNAEPGWNVIIIMEYSWRGGGRGDKWIIIPVVTAASASLQNIAGDWLPLAGYGGGVLILAECSRELAPSRIQQKDNSLQDVAEG
jgi:hypothetical protein